MVRIKNLNIEVFGIIYKIANTKNGKVYIGQTKDKYGFNGRYNSKGIGIERVYNYHKRCKFYGKKDCNAHLLNSIEKYGFEAFEVVEIFDVAFSQTELDIKEMTYIQLYDSFKNGYNRTLGSGGNKGYSPSQEVRQRISEVTKGENNPFYGCNHDEETRKRMSQNSTNRKEVMLGNVKFHNCEEFAKEYGLNSSTVHNWLNGQSNMPKEWYDKGLRYIDKTMNEYKIHDDHPLSKQIYNITDNIIYSSQAECGRLIGDKKVSSGDICLRYINKNRLYKDKILLVEATPKIIEFSKNNINYRLTLEELELLKLYRILDSKDKKLVTCEEITNFLLIAREWCDKIGTKTQGNITQCCKGKLSQTKGYHFHYSTIEEIILYEKYLISKLPKGCFLNTFPDYIQLYRPQKLNNETLKVA